jgi:hypothetical protein
MRSYFKEAELALLVFDISDMRSLDALHKWHRDIDDKV